MKGKDHLTQEFKYAVSDEGTFDGLLAAYNNVDLSGDLIEPGAFQKTLQENGNVIPLLWQHDPKTPIGNLTVSDSSEGLAVKGKILTDTPPGDYAYKSLKGDSIRGLSIGYDTVKSVWDGPIRRLKELRLWEGSVVTFPCNARAIVRSVKAAREQKDDFNAELAERQLYDAGPQILNALQSALYSVFLDSALGKTDKVAISQSSMQQFMDAYMAWLPEFLNFIDQEYGGMETMSKKHREHKEGRTISSSNKMTLKTAHDHIVSAADLILPLCTEEAGPKDGTTSEDKAGRKSEPDPLHSAAKSLEQLRSLLRAA